AQDAVPRGGGPYPRGPFLSFGTPGSGTSAPDTAPPAEDGGGLSPATGAAAPSAVPTPGGAGDGGGPRGEDAGDAERPGGEPDAPATRTGWAPPGPTPDDHNAIVHLLAATPAPDEAKARNPEAGTGGVVVPTTVYNLGIFRAPQGWKRITGPVERSGDELTATLHSELAGRPSITTRVAFVYRDGNWKLATRSVCEGVRTVGLPVACGG